MCLKIKQILSSYKEENRGEKEPMGVRYNCNVSRSNGVRSFRINTNMGVSNLSANLMKIYFELRGRSFSFSDLRKDML